MNNVKIFIFIIILLILGTIISVSLRSKGTPLASSKYDTFATCLKEKGAIFYGSASCPHCKEQKKLFGESAKLLPYVECSGEGTQNCVEKEIKNVPTWEFADGSRLLGKIPLAQLAEKTGCILPI
jgi:glutaredoxin